MEDVGFDFWTTTPKQDNKFMISLTFSRGSLSITLLLRSFPKYYWKGIEMDLKSYARHIFVAFFCVQTIFSSYCTMRLKIIEMIQARNEQDEEDRKGSRDL